MKINMDKLYYEIFTLENRVKWYDLIQPYIVNVNKKDRMTLIGDTDSSDEFDSDWFAFLPEELDPNFQWPFNLGDIVTDGKDIMKITALPVFDPRSEYNYNPLQIDEYGNRYTVIRLGKNGNNKEANDSTAYLHQMFNINEIHLASQEEIDKLFK